MKYYGCTKCRQESDNGLGQACYVATEEPLDERPEEETLCLELPMSREPEWIELDAELFVFCTQDGPLVAGI